MLVLQELLLMVLIVVMVNLVVTLMLRWMGTQKLNQLLLMVTMEPLCGQVLV
jgi:hypothetical protein